MPRIRVDKGDVFEILKLPSQKEEAFELWKHIYENGFLYNEFTLILDGWRLVYKVKVEGKCENQKIYIKEIFTMKSGLTKTKNYETSVIDFLDKLEKTIKSNKDCKSYEDLKDYDDMSIAPPMMFMMYAVKLAMNRTYKDMPVTTKKYKPMNERKSSNKKSELRLFDVIRRYEKHINHKKHVITCERWDVKGHFRHYKSGKVTYVPPFEKGKGKVKVDKEYKLK